MITDRSPLSHQRTNHPRNHWIETVHCVRSLLFWSLCHKILINTAQRLIASIILEIRSNRLRGMLKFARDFFCEFYLQSNGPESPFALRVNKIRIEFPMMYMELDESGVSEPVIEECRMIFINYRACSESCDSIKIAFSRCDIEKNG
jgi:hypothetical protein